MPRPFKLLGPLLLALAAVAAHGGSRAEGLGGLPQTAAATVPGAVGAAR